MIDDEPDATVSPDDSSVFYMDRLKRRAQRQKAIDEVNAVLEGLRRSDAPPPSQR